MKEKVLVTMFQYFEAAKKKKKSLMKHVTKAYKHT